MKLAHIALFAEDMETMKVFFTAYFGCTAGTLYNNPRTGFRSYFLRFPEGGVLELHLRDDATTFNPFTLDTSRASRDEAFDMDGMGVLVIKKRAKEFFYRRYQGFNTLIIKI